MSKTKELLDKARREALGKIKSILTLANTDHLYISDFSESESPIVHEDKFDDNFTYTLDEIERDKCGDILFHSSSSDGNTFDSPSDLDCETLCGIADWLSERMNAILDFYSPEFTEAQRDTITEIMGEQLATAIPDAQTRNSVVERLLPNVLSRLESDADWSELEENEVCQGDVEIALQNELAWLVLDNIPE